MKLLTYLLAAILVFLPVRAQAAIYTTAFPLTENPISQTSKWTCGKTVGLDWADVRTTPALAFGTQTGTDGFNDSVCALTGTWSVNQYVRGVVHNASPNNSVFEEGELHFHTTITAHSVTTYEVMWSYRSDGSCYHDIVKWPGPLGLVLGDFNFLSHLTGSQYCAAENDVLEGIAIDNGSSVTLTSYKNGVQQAQVTDSTSPYHGGNPGMGMFNQNAGSGANADYGFKSYITWDLGSIYIGGLVLVGGTAKVGN